MQYIVVFTRNS